MSSFKGRLQHDPARGVIYFFDDESGACLLRVEGLPKITPGKQIDIHLTHPGSEHHHENCGGRIFKDGTLKDDAVICAVKIPRPVVATKG